MQAAATHSGAGFSGLAVYGLFGLSKMASVIDGSDVPTR
jgi:hypothetical protein